MPVSDCRAVNKLSESVVVFTRLTTARASQRGPARLDERTRAAPAPDARLETLKDRTQRAHTQDHTHTYGYYAKRSTMDMCMI